jgi:VWA domain-containing protein
MCVLRPALSLALMLFATASLCAQSDCSQRTIPVTAHNRKTMQMIALNVRNLKATYGDEPVAIKSVLLNDQIPRVIVLLDLSSSMDVSNETVPDMRLGLGIATDLFSRLPQPTEVAFVVFGNKTERLVDFTTDRRTIVEASASLRTNIRDVRGRLGGATALWDAVSESIKMFGNGRVGDAIFAITDEDDNASHTKSDQVTASLSASGIRLFQVMRFEDLPRAAAQRSNRARVFAEAAADDTGGRATYVHTPMEPSDVDRVLADLAVQYGVIRNFLKVTLELPAGVRESSNLKLELTNVPTKNDAEMHYPRKLPACQ